MGLAIFDLDETLIGVDSDLAWGEHLAAAGVVDAVQHKAVVEHSYREYLRGELDVEADLAYVCGVLARVPMGRLLALREEFVATRIVPAVLPAGAALVDKHRRTGDLPMVITSTVEFVVEPIVRGLLGIETLIASQPEVRAGRFTGKVVGTPSFGEGKVVRLREWLAGTPHSLAGSHFYTDSHNDLPLLRLVDVPVAVDPDDKLRQEASANGWRIISLRD